MMRNKIKIKFPKTKIINIIENWLLAAIICINVIRYFLNIHESSVVIYGLYVLYIVLVLIRKYNSSFFENKGNVAFYLILLCLIDLYAIITSVALGTMMAAIKFTIMVVLSFCVLKMSIQDIGKVIQYSIYICIVYALSICVFFEQMRQYLLSGSNYLTVTLSLGMALTITLMSFVWDVFNKNNIRSVIINGLLSILFFYTLTKFAARGSIILPLLCVLFLILFLLRKNAVKFIGVLCVFFVVLFVFSNLYMNNASDFSIQRFMRLFNDSDSESRWNIWIGYLDMVIDRGWYLIGGGADSSKVYYGYYPHNFYLQLVGEYGILGIIMSIGVTGIIIRSFLLIFKNLIVRKTLVDRIIVTTFWEVVAGLGYFFLTFMKSFSIYDGSALFIFIAFFLRMSEVLIIECKKVN